MGMVSTQRGGSPSPPNHEVLHHGRTAPCGVEQCADGEGQGHDEGGQHQERHDGHGDAPAAASQPLHANHRRPRGHDEGGGPDECPEKRQERPEAAKEQQPDQQHDQDDPGDVAGGCGSHGTTLPREDRKRRVSCPLAPRELPVQLADFGAPTSVETWWQRRGSGAISKTRTHRPEGPVRPMNAACR